MSSTLPQTARGRATRERIVRAATEVIGERGAARMSLDEVTSRAGVSRGQLYHYFMHREALLHEAVRTTVDEVLSTQHSMMGRLDSWNAIEGWFACLVDLQVTVDARGGCPMAMLAAHLVESDEVVRAELLAGFERWETVLRDGLVHLQRAGELAPDRDAAQLATSTMAAVQGGLVLTQVRRDPTQLRTALDAAWSHLRAGAIETR